MRLESSVLSFAEFFFETPYKTKKNTNYKKMGNTHSGTGLENNFCVEISQADMTMLRVELTTADPSRALKQLELEPYHMPYFVEYGEGWKSYHDLIGEIDTDISAECMWKSVRNLLLFLPFFFFVSISYLVYN